MFEGFHMNSKGQIFGKLRTTVLEECGFLFVLALPGHGVGFNKLTNLTNTQMGQMIANR